MKTDHLVFAIDLRAFLISEKKTYSVLWRRLIRELSFIVVSLAQRSNDILSTNFAFILPNLENKDDISSKLAIAIDTLTSTSSESRKKQDQFKGIPIQINQLDSAIEPEMIYMQFPNLPPHNFLFYTTKLMQKNAGLLDCMSTYEIGEVDSLLLGKQGNRNQSAVAMIDIDDTLLIPSKQNKNSTVINPNLINKLTKLQQEYNRVDFIILTARNSFYRHIKKKVNCTVNLLNKKLIHCQNLQAYQVIFNTLLLLKSVVRTFQSMDSILDMNLLNIVITQLQHDIPLIKHALINTSSYNESIEKSLNDTLESFESEMTPSSTCNVIAAVRAQGIPLRADPYISFRKDKSKHSQDKIQRLLRYRQRQSVQEDYYFYENDLTELKHAHDYLNANQEQRISLFFCVDPNTAGCFEFDNLYSFINKHEARNQLLSAIRDTTNEQNSFLANSVT